MYLTYKQITIRNTVAEDAPQLAAWWNDGSVMAHAGFPRGLGITIEKIVTDIASDSDDTRRRLMLLADRTPIGEMCYRCVDPQTADIGIKICEADRQEQGIGRIALSMLIRHLFQMGCTKIILDTNPNNSRARHVYEKLGFRMIRINENSWKNQLGEWESSVDYELTKEAFHDFAV